MRTYKVKGLPTISSVYDGRYSIRLRFDCVGTEDGLTWSTWQFSTNPVPSKPDERMNPYTFKAYSEGWLVHFDLVAHELYYELGTILSPDGRYKNYNKLRKSHRAE